MSDNKKRHRGKHSNDDKCFNDKWLPILIEASKDLSFLLGKDYGLKSSVALVGNHYKLNARQQRALSLIACPAHKIHSRKTKALLPKDVVNKCLAIDGFNLLITVEAILSSGYIFHCQDGCYRDIAGIHGSYKKVMETMPALQLIDSCIKSLGISHTTWYFDQPVSNAGMLKTLLYDFATTNNSSWDIELVYNPDKVLSDSTDVVISSDSVVIDNCPYHLNLTQHIIKKLKKISTLQANNLNILTFNEP